MASDAYFSQKNEAMLQRVLYNDICRRTGNNLNERQAARLMKTVKYYMGEVHRVQGNKPVNTLNSEVLGATLSDYLMYLERSERSDGRSVVSDIEEGPGPQQQGQQGQQGQQQQQQIEDRSRQDVGTAFSHLQASRQESKSRPPMQDFRISLQDEGPVPMDVFERIKKDREEEATRVSVTAATGSLREETTITTLTQKQTQQTFAEATDVFARGSRRAEEEAEAAFAERERASLQARAAASSQVFATAPPPDMRGLFMGDRETIDRSRNRTEGIPTEVRSSGSQLLITREPDTMAYKETELNLFVYSGDRDWVSNSQETRYNFTVNFDPSNLPSGLRLNPTSTVKFRNIVRIEFVKAIVPGEGLDLMVYKTGVSAYASDNNMNVLSYPYIQVRIPELDNNVYGTNNSVNSAFGVLQYDANWISDSGIATQRGFLAMIPKFLKCQKVYSPTPLATLQKLSFRFERPDGTLLSKTADTLDITNIFPTHVIDNGFALAGGSATSYEYDPAVESTTIGLTTFTTSSAYYWIQSSKYFNHWTVSKGDRIIIKNLTFPGVQPTGSAALQMAELFPYLQQDSGLVVVDTGVITDVTTGVSAKFTNSYNSQGYANAILVRGKFADPDTGIFKPVSLGGVADDFSATSLSRYLVNNTLSAGRLLNQSHQVQVAMRVITRELDSTGILRPDNL
jgi:hypothetical protein